MALPGELSIRSAWLNLELDGVVFMVLINCVLLDVAKALLYAISIPFVRIVDPLRDGFGVTAFSAETLFCWGIGRLGVHEESIELWGELYGREEQVLRRVDASRRGICWVVFAADISCVNGMSNCTACDEGMHSFEYSVDCFITTASVLPTFDNSLVIPICDEISTFFSIVQEAPNEAFKSDSFSPSDVPMSVERLPARYETPCSPVFADDNGNTDF